MTLEAAHAKRDHGNCVNKSSEVQKIQEKVFVAYKNCMSQVKIQWEFLFSWESWMTESRHTVKQMFSLSALSQPQFLGPSWRNALSLSKTVLGTWFHAICWEQIQLHHCLSTHSFLLSCAAKPFCCKLSQSLRVRSPGHKEQLALNAGELLPHCSYPLILD